jgi:hypothetical protein
MLWTVILIVIGFLLLSAVCLIALGRLSFNRKTRSEVNRLFIYARHADTGTIITGNDI